MRRAFLALLVIGLLSGLCAGCTEPASEDGRLTVFVSFSVMEDFTGKIAGDRVRIQTLVPPGAEPHDWEPSAADMAKLEAADLFIYSGAGMEPWLESFQNGIQGDGLEYLNSSDGIALIGAGGSHVKSPMHADPHIWLDPMNAKKQMENIKEALVRLDPQGGDYYQQHYLKAAEELDALHEQYMEKAALFTAHSIVVEHEAYGYLCNAYGLTQIAIGGMDGEEEPSPARMAEVIRYIEENDVQYVFYAPITGGRLADSVANETGILTAELNSYEARTESQKQDGIDYFTVMRENLQALGQALS